uniref:Uncharacterized protein n=1 Tax=Lepeophtheirus salmonis TaxID=72036 RepID=A0A0K2T1Y0_LEPSM
MNKKLCLSVIRDVFWVWCRSWGWSSLKLNISNESTVSFNGVGNCLDATIGKNNLVRSRNNTILSKFISREVNTGFLIEDSVVVGIACWWRWRRWRRWGRRVRMVWLVCWRGRCCCCSRWWWRWGRIRSVVHWCRRCWLVSQGTSDSNAYNDKFSNHFR